MGTTATTISVKLPRSLAQRLDARSRRKGIGRSTFVRQAIENALREEDGAVPKESFLALCREFSGCVEGPGDLSYNKKYMRGYGRSH